MLGLDTLVCESCSYTNKMEKSRCTQCSALLPSDDEKLRIVIHRLESQSELQQQLDKAKKDLVCANETIEMLQELFEEALAENEKLQDKIAANNSKCDDIPEVNPASFQSLNQFLAHSEKFFIESGVLNGSKVVCKQLARRKFGSNLCEETCQKLKESARLTIRIASVANHCTIPIVGVSGFDGPDPKVYMELMEHQDLYSRSFSQVLPTLTTPQRYEIALQTIIALAEIHRLNLLHRDINPSHILLDNNDKAVLSGFSHAREVDENMTQCVGMFRYAAPETWTSDSGDGSKKSKYSESADIYSFGLLLVFIFTQKDPFSHIMDKRGRPVTDLILHERINKGIVDTTEHPWPADTHPELIELAKKCTNKDPEQRVSAQEAMNAIKRILFEPMPTALGLPPTLTARITVERARNITNLERFSQQDSYCNVQNDTVKFKSEVHKEGGKNPIWNSTFEFESVHLLDDTITFSLRKHNEYWFNADLGCCSLKLSEAVGQKHHNLNVMYEGHHKGQLYVTLELRGDICGWLQHFIDTTSTYLSALNGRTSRQAQELSSKLDIAKTLVTNMAAQENLHG